jgi:type II secretory pathway pseudopilin PulG
MNRKNAFTLIEVGAIVAAVAVLAAILFPVLAQARERTRRDTLLSCLVDLGSAHALYAQDYDETPALGSSSGLNGAGATIQPYARNHGRARSLAAMASAIGSCMAIDPSGEWQSVEGGCKDSLTHLVWSDSGRLVTGYGFSYPQAQNYCASLNSTSGYTGWGLATLPQHQTAYANHGASYIDNPTLFTEWTSSTYPGKGQYRKQTYDRAFDWANGTEHDIMIQDPYGTYSYADALCVRQGL